MRFAQYIFIETVAVWNILKNGLGSWIPGKSQQCLQPRKADRSEMKCDHVKSGTNTKKRDERSKQSWL